MLETEAAKIEQQRQRERYGFVETVEPNQFRKTGKVLNAMILRRIETVAHEPAGMGAEEAVLDWRMGICGCIGVSMVLAMVGCPPQRPPLRRRGAQEGEDKLRRTRGLKSAVREITVVNSRDRKHAHEVKRGRGGNRGPAPADQKNAETSKMHDYERRATHPVDAIDIDNFGSSAGCMIIGIEPLDKGVNYGFAECASHLNR